MSVTIDVDLCENTGCCEMVCPEEPACIVIDERVTWSAT